MGIRNLKPRHAAASLCLFAAGSVTCSGGAFAQAIAADDDKQQIQLLKQQMEALNKKLDALVAKQAQTANSQPAVSPAVASTNAGTSSGTSANTGTTSGAQKTSDADASGWGAGMPPKLKSLLAALGDMEFYGNLDLSVDYATKGLKDSYVTPGGTVVSPRGHMGWQPDVSSNLSYIGVRGKRPFGSDASLAFVYQLETQLDISATSGSSNSNSSQDSTVKGALTSRNSFIGVASPTWGALKIGTPLTK